VGASREHLLSLCLSSIRNGGEGGRRPGEEALRGSGYKAQTLFRDNPGFTGVHLCLKMPTPLPGHPLPNFPDHGYCLTRRLADKVRASPC